MNVPRFAPLFATPEICRDPERLAEFLNRVQAPIRASIDAIVKVLIANIGPIAAQPWVACTFDGVNNSSELHVNCMVFRTGTGVYRIIMNQPLQDIEGVFMYSFVLPSNNRGFITHVHVDKSTIDIYTFNQAGAATDGEFHFIAFKTTI